MDHTLEMKKPAAGFRRGLYDLGDGVNVPLICPTRQAPTQIRLELATSKPNRWTLMSTAGGQLERKEAFDVFRCCRAHDSSGLFYAASRHEIGSLGVTMCQYGSPFCDNPLLVLVGAGLAALLGRVRQRALTRLLGGLRIFVMMPLCR